MERSDHPDPQTWARVSILAAAAPLPAGDPDYQRVKALYLEAFPRSERSFMLADFSLFRLTPGGGRFVAGFGQIYNLTGSHFGGQQ